MKVRVRWAVSLALVMSTVSLSLMTATPALAALQPTPDTTWMTNGQVRAVLVSGNYLYVGGKFSKVRQFPNGVPGGGSFDATNLARIDLTTGAGDPTWTPSVTTDLSSPAVYALAAMGNQIWVGGSFTAVNGQPRLNVAAVSATTGAVDPAVAPLVGTTTADRVTALAAGPSLVYAGGYFTTVNGLTRTHLAAFHTDGTLDTAWAPRADKRVFSMKMDCTGSTLFVGGQFQRASNTGGPYVATDTIARFDLVNGTLQPWAVPLGTIIANQKAYAIAPTCTRLFVAYGGQNWASAFALDNGNTGNEVWRRGTNGNVQAIAYTGGSVVIGGHFTSVTPNTPRARIAALNPTTGVVDSTWNPGMDGNWGGPWAMAVEANHVWVGGEFKLVAGIAQFHLVRFTF
jgi:hypothetical protein